VETGEASRKKRIEDFWGRRRGLRFWLAAALGLYAILLAGITLNNWAGPDRWWLGSLNLYLPQWLWGIPAVLLLPLCLWLARKWAWAPLFLLLWVAGPLMGLAWGRDEAAQGPQGTDGPKLRVMTYNIKYGQRNIQAALAEIRAAKPDLLLLQDAGRTMSRDLGSFLKDWNVRSFGQYVIASHLPLSKPEICWISFPGEQHSSLRCELAIGGRQVRVYDVHLLTPREGLSTMKEDAGEGVGEMERNTSARLHQADALQAALQQERGPVILTGDLNAPEQSLVCRKLRAAGLRDAFSAAGRGYGYTYGHMLRFGHSFMRIDHIMVSPHWRVRSCWTGGAEGSDHRPVIADMVLAPSATASR
jgi:endonuclease/exonuclease/phosphatase (EEP) superfamily protein YafD